MKSHALRFVISLSVLLLAACAGSGAPAGQVGSPAGDAGVTSGKTDGGVLAVGQKTTAQVGAAGGHLTSPGGRVELVVPQGAVSADTEFSITEGLYTAPDGTQTPVFDLGPDGLTFPKGKEPTFTFHYTAKDLRSTSPELLAVRFVDHDGMWWQLGEVQLDQAAQTVSARLPHFTPYTVAPACQMTPADGYAVLVGDTAAVNFSCDAIPPVHQSSGAPTVQHLRSASDLKLTLEARVNDVQGGDDFVGRIRQGAAPGQFVYTAPGVAPQPATVLVRIDATATDQTGGVMFTTAMARELKVLERSWTMTFTWLRDASCADGTEPATYHYRVVRSFDFSLERTTPDGEQPIYRLVAQPQEPTQTIDFDDLHPCFPGSVAQDGSGTGVSITNVTGHYLREQDSLEFYADINLQDIPPFWVTDQSGNQLHYGTSGQLGPDRPYVLAGLKDGAVAGFVTNGADQTHSGGTFTLKQRSP